MGQETKLEAGDRPDDAGPTYRVRWWGQFGFVDARTGENKLPRGRRAQAILAMAVSRPGTPLLRSDLATMFWGDRGDEQARASLRQSLAELRELSGGDSPAIVIDQRSVTAVADRITTRDEQLAGLTSGDASSLLALLERGDGFLAGLEGLGASFDEWLAVERARGLEALVLATLEAAKKAVADARGPEAQQLVNRVQVIDPLDERLTRAGFDADAAASDAASLERRMRALEAKLRDELGVAPSPATGDAYASAMASLRAGAPPAAKVRPKARPAFAPRIPGKRLAAAIVLIVVAAVAVAWFVGRERPSAAHPRVIAVLPLNASADRQDLAGGISEEIVSRLSRNANIAPLGRGSAEILADDPASAIALGRELRVEYLLSGRLEGRGDQLSISAKLVRTSDGSTLWAETISGGARELITMMDRLSEEVSRRIGAGVLPQSTVKKPKPEANQLYLSALGLARNLEPEKVSTALELLRQAARIDPDYAPIWAALGTMSRTEDLQHLQPSDDLTRMQLYQAYARRALQLAPESAEANLAVGNTLAEDPRSIPYVLRALEIDPHNADAWNELSDKSYKAGDFVQWNYALNKAARLDPLSQIIVLTAADSNRDLGKRDEALRLVNTLMKHGQPQPFMRHFVRGFILADATDFSGALNEFSTAATSPNSQIWARSMRRGIFFVTGIMDEARPVAEQDAEENWKLFSGRDPGPSAVATSRRFPIYAWNMQERNYLLLRILANKGEFAEIASLYDRRFKSPEEFAHTPRGHTSFIGDSIPVVMALRQVGRSREAERIYALARTEILKRYRAGPVPRNYRVLAAQHYAIGGDQNAALRELAAAVNRGWLNRWNLSMPDIADEPAFRSLRQTPQFVQLRNRMEALYARERAEILAARSRAGSAS